MGDGNYSIQDIITGEDYDEYYPLNSTLNYIANTSNSKITDIIQTNLQTGTLYPSNVDWGLVKYAMDYYVFRESYYNNFKPNILYLTSYLFESTSDTYIKLLMSNYLGYLVDSDDSYLIQKGDYTPQ